MKINKTAVIVIIIIAVIYVIATIAQSNTETAKGQSLDRAASIQKAAATLVSKTDCSPLPMSQSENCKSVGLTLMFCSVSTDNQDVYDKCVSDYNEEMQKILSTPTP